MKNTNRDGITEIFDYLWARKEELIRLEGKLLRLERVIQDKNGQVTEKDKLEIKHTKLLILTFKNIVSEITKWTIKNSILEEK